MTDVLFYSAQSNINPLYDSRESYFQPNYGTIHLHIDDNTLSNIVSLPTYVLDEEDHASVPVIDIRKATDQVPRI